MIEKVQFICNRKYKYSWKNTNDGITKIIFIKKCTTALGARFPIITIAQQLQQYQYTSPSHFLNDILTKCCNHESVTQAIRLI